MSIRRQNNVLFRGVDAMIRAALRQLPPSEATERIALTWGYRFQPDPKLVQLRSGLRFDFNAADYISLWLYYLGTFEPTALAHAKRVLRAGSNVLDVGSNVGFYSIELAQTACDGRLVSIEAMPQHAAAVRRNLELNGLKNATVLQFAVGASDGGTVQIGLPAGGNPGMYSVVWDSENPGIEVPLTTIDKIIEEQSLLGLDLIKMDIEGSEFAALRGATRTLESLRPALLIELNEDALGRFDASPAMVKQLLRELGYSGWKLSGGAAQPIADSTRHVCDECLYLHRDRLDLAQRIGLSPHLT
jgi:FkbM family methyltransferase